MEFVTEFGLTNQQIVLLNEIDIGPGHEQSPTDFINSPVVTRPFEEIQYPDCTLDGTSDHSPNVNDDVSQPHQFQIIKQRNGNRYMKFKKSKKNVTTKPVDQQPQQCPVVPCRAVFTSKLKLRKHIQGHAFKKQYRCDICFEEFNVLENLTLHISLHSGDGRCPQCGKEFRRLASLEGHIKTHFKNEYYTCTQGCDEMFPLEWMLEQHINQFHPTENSKGQREKEELAKQRKLKRKLNCQYCGKKFSKNCLLIRHERIHNGQKPFQCDRCDRNFAQKNTLVIHQRRHADERMFHCTQCPQTFVQKGNLLSHIAKCHTYKEGEPSFPCNQCSCSFKKIGTLNAHISKFHAAQSVLVNDDLGFKVDDVMKELNDLHRSGSLENELISKDLFFNLPAILPPTISEEVNMSESRVDQLGHEQSDYANTIEATQSSLKLAVHTSNGMVTHRNVMQRIHGNVRFYVCLYCPKEFRRPSDLVRHIRIHTKEKPFSCPVPNCGKKFSVKSSLSTHLNTHSKLSQQYTCRVCLQTFSAETFDEHCLLTHQDNPIFQCFICSQFNCHTNGELKRHLKCHRSPAKVKKPAAQQELESGDIQLDIIMKEPIMLTNDGQIEVTTEKCVPDQERKFECSVCSSTFKRNGHLKEHMLSHLKNRVKSHKCDICFKSFGRMSILNRHMLYHSNEKKFKCGTCNANFISYNQLSRHSLKHTNQRNVMCPYCQKRFKSKATCRIHLQLHKADWVKQFKEQLKSGTIQFEEDDPSGQTNDQSVLLTSSTNEGILESLNDGNNETVQRNEESAQILFTNLVQEETQINDSPNHQFEYFLLLPSNGDPNGVTTGVDGRSDNSEQFVVNDEQLNFANLQFIQLEQSTLLELDNNSATQTVPFITNYRINDNELHEPEMDCVSNASQVPVPDPAEIADNVLPTLPTDSSTQIQLTNKKLTRKPTKSINKCETCSKIFQKPIDLRRHIRIHTKEKPFSCTNCTKSFSLKSTLQNHNKNKHSDMKEMYPCTVCWKAFSSKHAVITHTLIHSNSRPFKCEYCTTTFRTRGHLKIHQQIHLREGRKLGVNPSEIKTKKEKSKLMPLMNVMQEFTEQNVCEAFVDNYEFVEEMPDSIVSRVEVSDAVITADNISVMNTIYQCSFCPEQFNDKDIFSAHAATHKESLRCPNCHKVFTKPSLLKRHMIVHFGLKQFTCEICQKSYTQKATLQAHMGLHTGGASFECSQCHKYFNFKTNLTTHERQCNLLNNRPPS